MIDRADGGHRRRDPGTAAALDAGAGRSRDPGTAGEAHPAPQRVRGRPLRVRRRLPAGRRRSRALALPEVLPGEGLRAGERARRGAGAARRQPLRPAPLRRRHGRGRLPRRQGPAACGAGARRQVGPHPPLRLHPLRPLRADRGHAGELPAAALRRRGAAGLPGGDAGAQQALLPALPAAGVRARVHAPRPRERRAHRPGGRGGRRGAGPGHPRPPAAGEAPLLPALPHHAHRAAPPHAGALPDLVRRAHCVSPGVQTTRTPSWRARWPGCATRWRRSWPAGSPSGSTCSGEPDARQRGHHRHRREPGAEARPDAPRRHPRDRLRPASRCATAPGTSSTTSSTSARRGWRTSSGAAGSRPSPTSA